MKYRVVWGEDTMQLITRVQVALDSGWECQGGIALWVSPNSMLTRMYYQAMIKRS